MKLFTCPGCGHATFFEGVLCTRCGSQLGFAPDILQMLVVQADGTAEHDQTNWRRCGNYWEFNDCNWLVDASDTTPLCISCRLNRTIPDLSVAGNQMLWHRLEQEKRRFVYSALRLKLPVAPKTESPGGLAFDFMADPDPSFHERNRVLTGHENGLITINIAEADPVTREQMRAQMAEPYRTILGHFRHESGHYYWDRLVRDSSWLNEFRSLFGDERADYNESLRQNYEVGPPPDWPEHFVSSYASSHPWEDWAETWSHYLHMVDTLETAWGYGVTLNPRHADNATLFSSPEYDPYLMTDFDTLIEQWVPLTVALNSLNRSMGHDASYPFALATPVIDKLALVHRIVRQPQGSA
ncbi:MAG: putative zinc-binding metallopeptidase [Candidatus Competibacteraceae bacterium]|nr:putative zinc-binding metallopeptidase [Candidatus Competibacteraceae bacterium]